MLASGDFCIGGRELSRDEFERRLAEKFDSYKRLDRRLSTSEQLLAARQKAAGALRLKIAGFDAQCQEIEVRIEELQTSQHEIAANERAASAEMDETALAEAKRLADHLERSLAISQKLLAQRIDEFDEGPGFRDIVTELDSRFGSTQPMIVAESKSPSDKVVAHKFPTEESQTNPADSVTGRDIGRELTEKFGGRRIVPRRQRCD
jgi:hypothetical protein